MWEIIVWLVLIAIAAGSFFRYFVHEFIVPEGQAGLLYHNGKLQRTLEPGQHIFTGRNYRVAQVPMEKRIEAVSGQDLLTSDHATIKCSVVISYRITDPVAATHKTMYYPTDIHYAVQLALREVITKRTLDELLESRLQVGPELMAALAPELLAIGVTLDSAELRDIMLPGDLRRAFAESIRARKEGAAMLERARAEQATLRSLANSARMLENNPELMNLRILHTLGQGQNTTPPTLVLGVNQGVMPLPQGKRPIIESPGE